MQSTTCISAISKGSMEFAMQTLKRITRAKRQQKPLKMPGLPVPTPKEAPSV